MISALIHFVQTGFHESDDIIVSILSEVILGNWLHRWIGSLGYLAIHEGFTVAVITPFFDRYTLTSWFFSPSCCLIKLSCNCVNEEDLERATCHCTFESIGVYTPDKALFSQLQKNISSFWPSLDRYSLTIPPYYSLTIPPPQIALTHHTSIPDPEMTWLLDTTLTPI